MHFLKSDKDGLIVCTAQFDGLAPSDDFSYFLASETDLTRFALLSKFNTTVMVADVYKDGANRMLTQAEVSNVKPKQSSAGASAVTKTTAPASTENKKKTDFIKFMKSNRK